MNFILNCPTVVTKNSSFNCILTAIISNVIETVVVSFNGITQSFNFTTNNSLTINLRSAQTGVYPINIFINGVISNITQNINGMLFNIFKFNLKINELNFSQYKVPLSWNFRF